MNLPEPQSNSDAAEMAALYALDLLATCDRKQFEQALLDSVELNQMVRGFEETSATLAYGAPSIPMAAELKDQLFQRIAADPIGPMSDLVQLLNLSIATLKQQAAELSWSPIAAGGTGAEIATWQVDEAHREVAFFVRKIEGGLFPNHAHASGETVLVLEGDFTVGSQVYHPGEQVSSPGDTSHQPQTLNGCLLFCVSSMDDEILEI